VAGIQFQSSYDRVVLWASTACKTSNDLGRNRLFSSNIYFYGRNPNRDYYLRSKVNIANLWALAGFFGREVTAVIFGSYGDHKATFHYTLFDLTGNSRELHLPFRSIGVQKLHDISVSDRFAVVVKTRVRELSVTRTKIGNAVKRLFQLKFFLCHIVEVGWSVKLVLIKELVHQSAPFTRVFMSGESVYSFSRQKMEWDGRGDLSIVDYTSENRGITPAIIYYQREFDFNKSIVINFQQRMTRDQLDDRLVLLDKSHLVIKSPSEKISRIYRIVDSCKYGDKKEEVDFQLVLKIKNDYNFFITNEQHLVAWPKRQIKKSDVAWVYVLE
jgi:hypothetical protein